MDYGLMVPLYMLNLGMNLQVSMVSRLKHVNFVELLGYSVDGNSRILVFEFAQNGSLHDILHGTIRNDVLFLFREWFC